MKFIYLMTLFFLITIIGGCKKDDSFQSRIEGRNWILHSGRVYVEELEAPFNMQYFDHFGNGQNTSSMQNFGSSSLAIDSLFQYNTSWIFNSKFILNSKYSYSYETINDKFIRVYGLENGSARVLEFMYGDDNYLLLRTSSSYGNANGKNISWFSELVFTANGIECFNCLPDAIYQYSYGGIAPQTISNNSNSTYPLSGTKWVLQKYRQGIFEEMINDTLNFIGPITYTINSDSLEKTYSLSGSNSVGMRNFTLFECPSLPSSTPAWTTQVADYSIQQGSISGLVFSSYGNTADPIQIWIQKIN